MFKARCYGSSSSWYRSPRLGLRPHALWGQPPWFCDIPPTLWVTIWGLGGRGRSRLDLVSTPPALKVSVWLFLYVPASSKSVLLVFRWFSEIAVLYVVVALLLMRGCELRIFIFHHFELESGALLLDANLACPWNVISCGWVHCPPRNIWARCVWRTEGRLARTERRVMIWD